MKRIGLYKGAFLLLLTLCAALVMATDASAADAVTYLDAAWNETTKSVDFTQKSVTNYTVVTSGSTAWSAGWYVVNGDVTMESRVTVTGEVNLILCDGATLIVSQGITVSSGNSLSIYAQSGGTGTVQANGYSEEDGDNDIEKCGVGIGGGFSGDGGEILIADGEVIAQDGNDGAAGIGGGTGEGAGGSVSVSGGVVTATGGESGAGIVAATLSLSWTDKDNDSVTASSYVGTVTLAKDFVIGGESAILTAEALSRGDADGKKIAPFSPHTHDDMTLAP